MDQFTICQLTGNGIHVYDIKLFASDLAIKIAFAFIIIRSALIYQVHRAIAAFMVDFGRFRRKLHCGKLIPATQLTCIVNNIMKRCLLDKPTLQREQYGRFLVIEQLLCSPASLYEK